MGTKAQLSVKEKLELSGHFHIGRRRFKIAVRMVVGNDDRRGAIRQGIREDLSGMNGGPVDQAQFQGGRDVAGAEAETVRKGLLLHGIGQGQFSGGQDVEQEFYLVGYLVGYLICYFVGSGQGIQGVPEGPEHENDEIRCLDLAVRETRDRIISLLPFPDNQLHGDKSQPRLSASARAAPPGRYRLLRDGLGSVRNICDNSPETDNCPSQALGLSAGRIGPPGSLDVFNQPGCIGRSHRSTASFSRHHIFPDCTTS